MFWLPGNAGGLSAANFAGPIIPVGPINGVNAAFTLPQAPTGFLMVFLNGVLQIPGGVDYTLAGAIITFVAGNIPSGGPPADTIVAYYIHA